MNRLNSSYYDTIQRIPANLVDRQNCNLVWMNFRNITDNMLCGKVKEEYCLISGNGLVCENPIGIGRFLCGIASHGRNCAPQPPRGLPGVYTDVSKYHQWITNHTQAIWEEYQSKNIASRCTESHVSSIKGKPL